MNKKSRQLLRKSNVHPPTVLLSAGIVIALFLVPYILPRYWILLIAYTLPLAVTALAINLLFGYSGLLSLGHAALFSIGMYTLTILNFWYEVFSVETLLLAAVLTSFAASVFMGAICVRYSKIQFTLLTLATSEVIHAIFHKDLIFSAGMGGDVGIPLLLGVSTTHPTRLLWYESLGATPLAFIEQVYYHFALVLCLACVIVMWIIVKSQFGRTLQAIRDNELKAQFLGLRIVRYRFIAFVISGTFTGFAGALWTPVNGFASSIFPHWDMALEFAFYPVLGGSRTFLGPIVGAFVYKLIVDLTWSSTVYWKLLMGIIIVATVIAAPTGIAGVFSTVQAHARAILFSRIRIIQIKSPLRAGAVGELNEEYLEIKNNGRSRVNMRGWTVIVSTRTGAREDRYVFPEKLANGRRWTFDQGEVILLHREKGQDSFQKRRGTDAPRYDLYWGKDQPFWDSESGEALLFDEKGKLVHSLKVYQRSGSTLFR
jgi:branched-chain amino acid transport system permease protein